VNKAVERLTNKTYLLQNSRHPKQVPSFPTPALAHAPPARQTHRAPNHFSIYFASHARIIGICSPTPGLFMGNLY